ncbi:hypothetical protein [Nocardia amikacinitolerans]|uniref:hypothetical protein n=1 Tax=Nocardia amikacinitolerans TaxID=756689 RepID=UPI0020A5C8EC|nr:hypothetical protein [Nocardia amikacinitolerans]MCP2279632.1 hypothetical protein [Nocardia amikacinitolerans]
MSDMASGQPYHANPGDSLADPYNIPGIVLFIAGVVGLASMLTAAGNGISGWVVIGSAATALCFVASVTVFFLEHERLRRLALRRVPVGTEPQTPA